MTLFYHHRPESPLDLQRLPLDISSPFFVMPHASWPVRSRRYVAAMQATRSQVASLLCGFTHAVTAMLSGGFLSRPSHISSHPTALQRISSQSSRVPAIDRRHCVHETHRTASGWSTMLTFICRCRIGWLIDSFTCGKGLRTLPRLAGLPALGEHSLLACCFGHVAVVLAWADGQRHLEELFVHGRGR